MIEATKAEVTTVVCSVCNLPIAVNPPGSFTTGYGVDSNGSPICYQCCAEGDREYMREHGKNTLYLTKAEGDYWLNDLGYMKLTNNHIYPQMSRKIWVVTNWPASLVFKCTAPPSVSWHNMARKRYDVWFAFEGYYWHGYTIGDNTQICHCKRTKQTTGHK